MLVVEGPLDTNYTGVVGGKLVSASAEAEASAEQQGRPQHKIALIEVDHMLSNGADQDVVVNVTASEQARSLAAAQVLVRRHACPPQLDDQAACAGFHVHIVRQTRRSGLLCFALHVPHPAPASP